MPSKLFSVAFVVILLTVVGVFVTQALMVNALYSECVSEGKKKSVCMKTTMREMGGRGYNIKMETDDE